MREEREERSRGESGAGVREDRSTNKRKMRSVGMFSYMMGHGFVCMRKKKAACSSLLRSNNVKRNATKQLHLVYDEYS